MSPAEIEAEAERLFKVWASTLALPADWKLPGEVTRAAWLAVGEASLRALADMTAERDHLKRREQSIIEACERVTDGGQYRADIVSAIQRLRRDVEAGDRERDALRDAHARIAALPEEKRHEAARRLSRSYSAPRTCVEHDGCQREGDEIVWPDGERWPTRSEGT